MESQYIPITFRRDVQVIQIPSGSPMDLQEGISGLITQSLGDSWTIVTSDGWMVRLQGKDADAIGKEIPESALKETPGSVASAEELEKLVWEQLRTCYDPEIPVNIADLGLVYVCEVTPTEPSGYRVHVAMTLTAPGCGMGDFLKAEAENKIELLPDVQDVDVEMVFDPPWDPSMMPEEAKLQLGML